MMAALAAAASGGEQQAAAPEANARPLPTLDPLLFMAARRGDSGQLKDLLRLDDDVEEVEQGTEGAGASATAADGDVPVVADEVVVDIEVDPPAAAVAPPAPPAPDIAADGEEQGTLDRTAPTAEGMSVTGAEDGMLEVVDPRHDDAVAPPSLPLPATAAENDIEEENVDPRPHDTSVAPPQPPPAEPSASRLLKKDDGVTIEGDSLLHVVAACGDGPEFIRCAKMIVRHKEKGGAAAKRLALEARNNDGDTPLHCAAGAGNAAMIECLLHLLGHDHEPAAFVRIQNERGETALHHAVKWACMKRDRRRAVVVNNEWTSMIHNNRLVHSGCIGKLVAVDAELASIVTHDGTSPLYIAISLGGMEIARYLLVTAKEEGNLSYYSGPGGQNILHAAVLRGDVHALRMCLKWLEEPKRSAEGVDVQVEEQQAAGDDGRHHEQTRRSCSAVASAPDDDVLLIRQLTSQRDKENGSTPLHLAASLSGFPSTGFSPGWTWKRSGRAAARLLLDANVSTAYQPDKEGMYPIHVAAGGLGGGGIVAVNDLLKRCPECATLRDAKGRTFLHVAVDNGRFVVVRYYVSRRPELSLSRILNAQDSNGDTALHRAIHAGDYATFLWLFWNRQVRLDIPNNKGMRPIDVLWSTMPLGAYYAWDPRTLIRNSLLKVSAPYGESRGDLFFKKKIDPAIITPELRKQASEGLTSAAQVMGILSVLVTTVTFATAFTLPGGYSNSGTPVLAGSYAFDAFILADALAFICSLLATSLLLYAGVPAGRLRHRFFCVNRAYGLMMNSGRSLVAAFGLGLYVTISPVARVIPIAVAVLVAILVKLFVRVGEGIDFTLFIFPVFPRRRTPSVTEVVAGCVVTVLEHFWSFIIIFGLPAIRKWARAR